MSVQVSDLVASLRGEDKNFTSLMATAALRVGNLHLSTSSAIGGVGALGVALTALAAGGLAASIKQAADFQSLTQKWANNAGLSAAGTVAMSNAVKQVSMQTGQSFDSLAHGYSTIVSHSFTAAQSLNVLTVAARNAAATGGDAYENAYMLSGILKEYGSSGQVAANSLAATTRVMDTLHAAVTNSAWSMNQFVEGSKKAIGVASQYDVPLATVTAELAALSQHGFANAANAGTAWSGMLTRLAAPTAAARIEFARLSATTGVNLVADMKSLQSNGAFLPQFLADIRLAAEKTGLSMNQFISTDLVQLMPQKAYRQALAALLKYQDDVVATTAKTTAAAKGLMANGTDEAFAAQQKTLDGQLADLRQSFNVLAVDIGTAFIPVLTRAVSAITPFVQLLTTKGIGPAMAKLSEDITGAFSRVDWQQVLHNTVDGLHTVFLGMESWLQNTGLPFLQARLTDITVAFKNIKWGDVLSAIESALLAAFSGLTAWWTKTGQPALENAIGNLGTTIPVTLSAAWRWASDTATKLKAWLDAHGDEIKKDIAHATGTLTKDITVGLKAVWGWASTNLGNLTAWLAKNGDTIKHTIATAAASFTKDITVGLKAAWGWASTTLGDLQTWLNHHGDAIKKAIGTGAQVAGPTVMVALKAAWGWATTTLADLQTWLNQHKKEIDAIVKQALQAAGHALTVAAVNVALGARWVWQNKQQLYDSATTWIKANTSEFVTILAGAAGLFLAGPAGLVIGSIVGGTAAVGVKWVWDSKDQLVKSLKDWWKNPANQPNLQAIGDAIGQLGNMLSTTTGQEHLAHLIETAIGAAFGKVGTWLGNEGKKKLAGIVSTFVFPDLIPAGALILAVKSIGIKAIGNALGQLNLDIGNLSLSASAIIVATLGTLKDMTLQLGTMTLNAKNWILRKFDIGTVGTDAASKLTSAFIGVPQDIYNYLAGRVKGVASVKDEITHYFSDAGTWLKDAGGKLIKGLWDGMTGNPFFQKMKDFFDMLNKWGSKLGLVSYSGGSVTGMPVAYTGSGFGATGPVQVTVNSGAITVTGLGSPANNADAAHAIGQALGEFTRQMVTAQRGVTNTVQRSVPGAV